MNERKLENLSTDEKKEVKTYIEGREDLFDTKVLQLGDQEGLGRHIVVASRDTGSANALYPVVELLQEKGDDIKVITDGRAREVFQKQFKTKDITPEGSIFKTAETVGNPDLGLVDASAEQGIELFYSTTFPEVPSVLIADHYYGSSLKYIQKLRERNLPIPKKICVMDEVAKDIIVQQAPELEEIIEVTGQPAFDKFAKEDTDNISRQVREKLGVDVDEKLVTFMATLSDKPELMQIMAESLAKQKGFTFIFRNHPRDNKPIEEYYKMFEELGIKYLDTRNYTTDEIGASSDVVIATTSTEGISSIYRRKPTISIADKRFINQRIPSAELGASLGVDDVEETGQALEALLNEDSAEYRSVMQNMEKYYKADGKNAQRVVDVVENVLKNKE